MSALFSDPTVWVALAFVAFVVAVAKPVASLLPTALDERARKIRADIEEAERLRADAQELLSQYLRKQQQAAREAEDIVSHAREEAMRLAEEGSAKLEQTLARREQMALDRIARAEAQALAAVRNKAIDVSIEAARRLLAEKLSASRAQALIDGAIRDLPKRLH